MTSRSERNAGKQTRQSLRLWAIFAPPTTWLGLRHHVIKIVVQRLLRRWSDQELIPLPRWLVVGDHLQPPKSDSLYHTKIRIHFANVHAHSDIIVEIKLKVPFKASYLPSRLARRGGGKSPKNAANRVLRKEAGVDVAGGHEATSFLLLKCLSMNAFGKFFVMQDALNSQQKLIYIILAA